MTYSKFMLQDKENEGPQGRRHCDVTVTLTLSSQASDDVLSVLRNLANVLRIPVPVNYSVTERSLSQPSQKLGLYRVKGKDGKEGGKFVFDNLFFFDLVLEKIMIRLI